MVQIQVFVEQLLASLGMAGTSLTFGSHTLLAAVVFLLAFLSGWLCRKLLIPVVLKITSKTEMRWDDTVFNRDVLLSACSIPPAMVIWQLLPWTFFDFPTLRELLARLTAIYIAVMSARTVLKVIDSLKLLGDRRSSRQQYLNSLYGVVKIIVVFVTVIVVVAIVIDKNPSTLFAGLGAASAILMLAFQDTIKGLVAGIRLTTNEMVHVGDWITVPSAGANGRVEEITLTTVKIRNFDNTIITVTPQTLVDGSFQNWAGMEQNEGRKQSRRVFYDFRSICIDADGEANITKFRKFVEQWLATNTNVCEGKRPLVRQAEATQGGCCVEFTFWLKAQNGIDYEHATSEIMEFIYAAGNQYGLVIYQQFPQQQG